MYICISFLLYTDPPEAPSSYGPAPHFALGHKNYMTAHAIVVVADAAVAGSGSKAFWLEVQRCFG